METNISQAVLASLNGLNDAYNQTSPDTGSGNDQSNWPAANKTHNMIIHNMIINEDAKFFMGKGVQPLPCIDISFFLETIPDTSSPEYDEQIDKPIKFTSKPMSIVPADLIKGELANTEKGKGWVINNARARLKAYALAVLGDEAVDAMAPGDQIVAMLEKLSGEAAVYARIFIDEYKKTNEDGEVSAVYLTDKCKSALEIEASA